MQQGPAQAPRPGLTAAALVEALQQKTVTLLVRCSTVEEALAVSGAVECDQDVMIGVDLP